MRFLLILSLIASIAFSFEITTGQAADIFIKGDGGKYKLGTLKCEEQAWTLQEHNAEFPSGTYCVGIDGHECFNYIHVDCPVHKTVLVRTNNGTISSVALLESEEEGLELQQREIRKGASPQLNTHNTVLKEGGEHVEPVVLEQSFIQKYWMYIVPPLVIFLLLSGDKK